MLRVRIDGGQLTTEQLRVIGEISVEFGRDTADLTDRQNIQLHWIRVEDVPEIWRRLEAVGLGTTEACGDVPRVILGSPVAGIAADELIDPTPQIDEITSAVHRRRIAREPASQVQVGDHRASQPGRRARDQRRRVRRSRAPRARRRLRPLGRRRAVDRTHGSPSGSAPGSPPSRSPRRGTASRRSSATTGIDACATRPASSSCSPSGVPSSSARCSRPSTSVRPFPTARRRRRR